MRLIMQKHIFFTLTLFVFSSQLEGMGYSYWGVEDLYNENGELKITHNIAPLLLPEIKTVTLAKYIENRSIIPPLLVHFSKEDYIKALRKRLEEQEEDSTETIRKEFPKAYALAFPEKMSR